MLFAIKKRAEDGGVVYLERARAVWANALGPDTVYNSHEVLDRVMDVSPVTAIMYRNDKTLELVVVVDDQQPVEEQVHFEPQTTAAPTTPLAVSAPSCTACSKKMVLRSGPYGQFWGCRNYPKCKYTKKVTT